ncbi:MAG: hypothetical protein ACI8TP_001421 [Acidimicrobiales bacterium]
MRSRVGKKNKIPGMVRILAQLTAMGGAGREEARGDLHIEFELDDFGMFDFKKANQIIRSGHAQALTEIAQWKLGAETVDLSEQRL